MLLFLIIVILFVSIWFIINWLVHIQMCKDHCRENNIKHKWSFHNEFITEFKKVNWVRRYEFKDSFFIKWNTVSMVEHNGNYIHASILTVNNTGYIINNPISHAIACLIMKINAKKYEILTRNEYYGN